MPVTTMLIGTLLRAPQQCFSWLDRCTTPGSAAAQDQVLLLEGLPFKTPHFVA